MELDGIKTIVGTYTNSEIITPDGEIIKCITYNSVHNQIENKFGAFNLRWSDDIDKWIIFQYVLMGGFIEDVTDQKI